MDMEFRLFAVPDLDTDSTSVIDIDDIRKRYGVLLGKLDEINSQIDDLISGVPSELRDEIFDDYIPGSAEAMK